MKRFLFLIIGICLLYSCNTIDYIPKKTAVFDVDFTKYASKGFLITPHEYTGNYESIGLITYKTSPKAKFNTSDWYIDQISLNETIDSVYNICIKKGADALIDFKFEWFDTQYNKQVIQPVTIPGIRISGFAIKRKP